MFLLLVRGQIELFELYGRERVMASNHLLLHKLRVLLREACLPRLSPLDCCLRLLLLHDEFEICIRISQRLAESGIPHLFDFFLSELVNLLLIAQLQLLHLLFLQLCLGSLTLLRLILLLLALLPLLSHNLLARLLVR